MGSQSVTDFSKAKTKRIRARIYEYNPRSTHADRMAWDAGAEVIGTLSKSSPYAQALGGASVKRAYDQLLTLAEDLQKSRSPQDVLAKHGIPPETRAPYGALAARVRQELDEDLAASSRATDAAPAAKDALGRTLLTVISEGIPQGRNAAEASAEEISAAFRRVGESRIAELFLKNVLSSLERLSLDATRGKAPPAKVAQVAKKIDRVLAPKVGEVIVRSAEGAGVETKQILEEFGRGGRVYKAVQKDFEKMLRDIPPEPPIIKTTQKDEDDKKEPGKGKPS